MTPDSHNFLTLNFADLSSQFSYSLIWFRNLGSKGMKGQQTLHFEKNPWKKRQILGKIVRIRDHLEPHPEVVYVLNYFNISAIRWNIEIIVRYLNRGKDFIPTRS